MNNFYFKYKSDSMSSWVSHQYLRNNSVSEILANQSVRAILLQSSFFDFHTNFFISTRQVSTIYFKKKLKLLNPIAFVFGSINNILLNLAF